MIEFIKSFMRGVLDNAQDQNITGEDALCLSVYRLVGLTIDKDAFVEQLQLYNEIESDLDISWEEFKVEVQNTMCMFISPGLIDQFLD